MQTVEGAIRWEGNNLPAIRDFIANLPAVMEEDAGKCHILIFEGADVILEIMLNHGDGLLWQNGMLGVARNVIYSNEMPAENESVH